MPRKKKTTDEQLADAELEEQKLKAIIEKKNEQLKIIANRKKQLTARKNDEKQKATDTSLLRNCWYALQSSWQRI